MDTTNKPVAWLLFFDGEESYPQYTKSYKQMREWETYLGDNQRIEPHYTHPVKELTDEEIYRLLADSIWAVGLNTDCLDEQNWADGITVARAILRKAQEK